MGRVRDDAFYNTIRWRSFRQRFLYAHPVCVECDVLDVTTAASVVDHLIPRKEAPELSFVESNCQALCKPCHERKHAVERFAHG